MAVGGAIGVVGRGRPESVWLNLCSKHLWGLEANHSEGKQIPNGILSTFLSQKLGHFRETIVR